MLSFNRSECRTEFKATIYPSSRFVAGSSSRNDDIEVAPSRHEEVSSRTMTARCFKSCTPEMHENSTLRKIPGVERSVWKLARKRRGRDAHGVQAGAFRVSFLVRSPGYGLGKLRTAARRSGRMGADPEDRPERATGIARPGPSVGMAASASGWRRWASKILAK